MESRVTRKKVVENSIVYTVELQRNCTPYLGCNRKSSSKAKLEWKTVERHIVTIQVK